MTLEHADSTDLSEDGYVSDASVSDGEVNGDVSSSRETGATMWLGTDDGQYEMHSRINRPTQPL